MKTFKEFLLEAHSYGAIMGTLSNQLNEYITQIQNAINKDDLFTGEDDDVIIDGIQKHYRHVTIFYGLTNKHFKDPLKSVLRGLIDENKDFTITTKGIEYFDNKDYSVAYLAIESPELLKLHEKIAEFVPEYVPIYPEYTPHIAIAWLKKGKKIEFEIQKSFTEKFKEIDIQSPDE